MRHIDFPRVDGLSTDPSGFGASQEEEKGRKFPGGIRFGGGEKEKEGNNKRGKKIKGKRKGKTKSESRA